MLRDAAIRNNASWCDAVCRSHGIATTADDRSWRAARRSPPFYPDAISLAADAGAEEVLAGVDTGPGCSVKDSFASLDLSASGFRVLLDGRWIARPPVGPMTSSWTAVTDERSLAAWVVAWRADDTAVDVFRPALLTEPGVAIVADWQDGAVVAGAALHASHGVVGVTNLFNRRRVDPWPACLATVAALHPDRPVVAYVEPDAVRFCQPHGFGACGSLRVWMADDGVRRPSPAPSR